MYAIETSKTTGASCAFGDVKNYLKTNTALYNSGGNDLLGNSYGAPFAVDTIPKVHATTFAALSDVAPAAFWSPFR